MIRAGIVGAAGYTGGELIRILLQHPEVDLAFAQSNSQAGKKVWEIHQDLLGDAEMDFVAKHHLDVEVLFLCGGHGRSREFLAGQDLPPDLAVVDLSADFRLDATWSYGLPELHKAGYGKRIANPGCFATAIQLALLPLAKAGCLPNEIHVTAITGSTGAGQGLSPTSHFSYRSGNLSVYKPFAHQHLAEIESTLKAQQGELGPIHFVPMRGPFPRGIFASLYTQVDFLEKEALEMYRSCYENESFTLVSELPIHLKQVLNTNKCLLHVEKHGDLLHITSAIDNLLKGAVGQAVQNMNILFELEETCGLKLKGSAF